MIFKKSGPPEWLLVCLGNYGKQYENTRHNIGFMAAERLIDKRDLRCNRLRFRALTEVIEFGGANVLLMMPQTYMNLSGESVAEVMNFYKLDPDEEMIVIFDDISLEPGRIRIRKKGSAGGHNGIKSIIAMTGTQGFSRIKVGVGEKPQGWDLADHVLGRFSSEDRAKVEEAIGHAMDAAVLMMQGETDKAMNIYN